MYNTILVPTDFAHEDQTIQSLKQAEKLAGNGRIVLLHVVDQIPAYALIELPDNVAVDQIKHAREELQKIAKEAGVHADVEVRKGRSYNQIIQSADEINADLILINSHRPGLKDYLLGSTAAKVVRHAQCAVLVER